MTDAKSIWWLDEFTDEISPAGPTLQSWADWLNDPAPTPNLFARAETVVDGQVFSAHKIDLFDDVVATWTGGAWKLSHEPPPEADFFAVRIAQGMGWGEEGIGDSVENALSLWDDGVFNYEGDQLFVAIGRHDDATHKVRFWRDAAGARLELMALVH